MEAVDFYAMKRKKLQAKCKKNKIPANLTNLEMANRLTQLFTKDKANDGCAESEGKKVKFSPETEVLEYTRSRPRIRRSTRLAAANSD